MQNPSEVLEACVPLEPETRKPTGSEASDSRGGGTPHDGNRDVRAVKAIAAMTFAIQLARFIKTQEPAKETPRPK